MLGLANYDGQQYNATGKWLHGGTGVNSHNIMDEIRLEPEKSLGLKAEHRSVRQAI